MKVAFAILLSVWSMTSNATEVAPSRTAHTARATGDGTHAQMVRLGDCKPAKERPEAAARAHAEKAGLSKEDLLARLIYSESLSTGYWNNACNANSMEDILTSVGWGIMNRVKAKASGSLDAYSDVIFAPKQFATSFSSSKENPFAESFLCPLDAQKYLEKTVRKTPASELFRKAQQSTHKIVAEYETSGIPKAFKGITNFFYPHSEYFGELRPKWAPEKDATKNKGYLNLLGVNDRPCVEFYKLK